MTVMKHTFSAVVAGMLLASSATAQQPLFQNFGTLDNPAPIDALAVDNFGSIFTSSGSLLFDTESTRSFTNQFTGIMQGFPGFQFDLVQGYYRYPSSNFVNSGSIFATQNLKVYSANIQNSGLLQADTGGRVLLQGNTVNLSRSSVRAGEGSPGNLGTYSQGGNGSNTNYTNPTTLIDEYWGTGDGGNLNLGFLNNGGFSPSHLVSFRTGGSGTTSINVNPETTGPLFPGYSFYVVTNYSFVSQNNADIVLNGVVQMVFVQTNLFDSPDTQVFFHNASGGAFNTRQVTVQFAIPDVDNITRLPYSRYYRFTDNSARSPNYNLFQNSVRPGHFRPGNFNLVRSDFPSFNFPANAVPFDRNYIFNTAFQFTNPRYATQFPPHQYSAWQFSLNPTSFGGGGFGSGPGSTALNDFTNHPGRVEIIADQLNLRQAKIRADNLLSIKATNLVDTFGVDIDALHINLELEARTGTVVLSNMFPTTVQRLNGAVSAWSGTWAVDRFVTNIPPFFGNNTIRYQYHMLVLDNQLVTNRASSLENFCVKAPNVFLADDFTVNKCFQLLATCLVIETNGAIVLSGTNINSTAYNLPNLTCLTNRGTFSAPQLANFGFDRSFPYEYIVNEGTFTAGSLLFRSDHFINTNTLIAFNGPIFIDAKSNLLAGGFLFASTDVRFSGVELLATNSTIFSSGTISLALSNRVSDLGQTNDWFCEQGLKLLIKPTKGDLLHTRVTSSAVAGATVFHDWAAENRGNSSIGFLNNVALGRLVLDGATNSTFVFSGTDFTGGTNGMYINFLDLQNNATNFASAIQIDPNVIVYFADSNLPPDKLTNAFGGRLVWVTSYAGPAPIGIPVALANGKTTRISTSSLPADLLTSTNTAGTQTGFTISRVSVVNLPPLTTVISWQGQANTTYTVEYTTSLASPSWQTLLTTFAPADGTVTVGDQAGSPGQRFYRVRYSR